MSSTERARIVDPVPINCVRCRREIAANAAVVFEHGDVLHETCWLALMCEARTANLRQVVSLALERLKRARPRPEDQPSQT